MNKEETKQLFYDMQKYVNENRFILDFLYEYVVNDIGLTGEDVIYLVLVERLNENFDKVLEIINTILET